MGWRFHGIIGALAGMGMLAAGIGCADMSLGGAPDLGVTPGGSQDLRYAREIIIAGGIPAAEHFTAEGLFSEHDLPLSGEECHDILCPRAAAAWTDPVGAAAPQMLVQLGFATNVDPESFQRPPLNLALCVDISGSMSSDNKMPATHAALHVLVDQLDEQDTLALVAFDNNAYLREPMTVMDEQGRDKLHHAIDQLSPQGSTDIEGGMALAYEQVVPGAGDPKVGDRVMLFTDAQPNTGPTDINSFLGITQHFAEQEIGLSVFGVGLDLGTELAAAMSSIRGGNYFYLADEQAIRTIFDDEFDFMVTPVAYDLEVRIATAAGMELADAYGFPGVAPGEDIEFGATTLFFSNRSGGMGVALRTAADTLDVYDGMALAAFDLSYLTAGNLELVENELEVGWHGGAIIAGEVTDADDLGVYKMGGLVDEYLALMAGARFCQGDASQDAAIEDARDAAERLRAMATHLEDKPLHNEASLMFKLADNIAGGHENCAPADTHQY